ncbi:MAG: hypothetical protein GY750_08285 [Lentisphaerae bacterium]|nr:hypothetical protein [Lentisphaerota bacterium]
MSVFTDEEVHRIFDLFEWATAIWKTANLAGGLPARDPTSNAWSLIKNNSYSFVDPADIIKMDQKIAAAFIGYPDDDNAALQTAWYGNIDALVIEPVDPIATNGNWANLHYRTLHYATQLALKAAFDATCNITLAVFEMKSWISSIEDIYLLNNPQDAAERYKGDATIIGGDEDDRICGFDGNDRINGGTGDDTVDGGADNDEYFYSLGSTNPSPIDTTTRLHFLMNSGANGEAIVKASDLDRGTDYGTDTLTNIETQQISRPLSAPNLSIC